MPGSMRLAALDTLTSPHWWRQQSWLVTTEVLMGFLAAWGLIRHLPTAQVGLGLALVYLVSAIGVRLIRTRGRYAALGMLAFATLTLVVPAFIGGPVRWYGLCASIGVLLAFRDAQTVHAMAWMPVRTRRRGLDNTVTLKVAAVLSGLILATALVLAGFISNYWRWLPHLMVLVALVFLVPRQLQTIGRGLDRKEVPDHWRPTHRSDVSWILKMSVAANAVNFLGRRLLLPGVLLSIASYYHASQSALPLLGTALGLMGIFGTLARLPPGLSRRTTPDMLLRWGARATLLGWAILSVGVLLWGQWSPAASLPAILVGWILLELTNRTWTVALVERLRTSSAGDRHLATRAHRRTMHRFMVRKSTGAAVGLAVGGLVAPAVTPMIVMLFVLGCWAVLERLPPAPSAPENP